MLMQRDTLLNFVFVIEGALSIILVCFWTSKFFSEAHPDELTPVWVVDTWPRPRSLNLQLLWSKQLTTLAIKVATCDCSDQSSKTVENLRV